MVDQAYVAVDKSTANQVMEMTKMVPPLKNLNDETMHSMNPFMAEGDFFNAPYISPDANKYNGTPDSYKVFMQNINNMTPTPNQLDNVVGGYTPNLPGPYSFGNDYSPNSNPNLNSRANNLSMCAQNMSTSPNGQFTVASSLLPNPMNNKFEGFEDCDTTNVLGNQAFLADRIGADTVASSLRIANYDIRSAPPCPITNVGPWNLSTVYPDLLRRPLEGCGSSFGVYGTGPNSIGVSTNINS